MSALSTLNPFGALAVVLSVAVFGVTWRGLRAQPVRVRLGVFVLGALLSVPSLLFVVYYLHVLPERAWFYTLRSWPGSEFLVVFLGGAAGAAASFLPRLLLGLPLFALLALATIPYLKPVLSPLPEALLHERWQGGVCLQSSASTCGPASVSTILRRLGREATERAAARAAYTSLGGTEAWYLARYVRRQGLAARFCFTEPETFTPAAGLPAVVGVRTGGAGHFIAVLAMTGEEVTLADPRQGEERLSLAEFRRRYRFTGFQMAIRPR